MIKIEFSGTDGSGKTTALKYFVEMAVNKAFKVVETREVGNPNLPSCVKLREFVLDPLNNLSGKAMELLFSAMRYENDNWLTKLGNSDTAPDLVVSDRGWIDHLAYTDHNVSEDFTNKLYYDLLEGETALPDIVVYFNVNTETALNRRIKRGEKPDAIEIKGVAFQEKVRESFDKHLAIFQQSRSCSTVYEIDANQDLDNVKKQLDNILDKLYKFI